MCGLFGHSHTTNAQLAAAKNALATLAHRGPNGQQFTHVNGVFLGHRRLSILDTSSAGNQPMVAGGVHLTVNGEIYNFKQLRNELEAAGATFTSNSDSEVIVHGYRHWGLQKLLPKLDGMFAIVLHDTKQKTIHLVRDPVGIKPLYYGLVGKGLAWASELKALEAFYGPQTLTPDPTALYDFLSYKYIPAPKTLYQNVFKLLPGHALSFNTQTGQHTMQRYWQLQPNRRHVDEISFEDATQTVRHTVQQAVTDQLVADVPLGAFLSGGVDSSAVCAAAIAHVPNLTTCSIGMEDPAVDESHYAHMVAQELGTRHITQTVGEAQVAAQFANLKPWFDEPFADTSALPSFVVANLAAAHMTVVLTGDGGDELFGGYSHYTDWWQSLNPALGALWPAAGLLRAAQGLPAPVGTAARRGEIFALKEPLLRQLRLRGGLLPSHPAKVALRGQFASAIANDYDDAWAFRQHDRADLSPRSRQMWLDFHTSLPDDMLTKVDRTSMAASIEARVPLLAASVVETAWSLPEDYLFHDPKFPNSPTPKAVLKAAFAPAVPPAALYRRKQGFAVGRAIAAAGQRANAPVQLTVLKTLFPQFSGACGA